MTYLINSSHAFGTQDSDGSELLADEEAPMGRKGSISLLPELSRASEELAEAVEE